VHVVGCAALGLLDHLRGAVDGVDVVDPLGESGRERSGATSDVQYPTAVLRHPTEE
jgi:hypothetical protein